MTEYKFDLSAHRGKFTVEIDSKAEYGYFEHDTLGDECGGGLWFKDKTLIDADGTSSVPKSVIKCLRSLGYCVPRIFEPDGLKTITHASGVPGFEIMEYEDKTWSNLYYWVNSYGESSEPGFSSIEAVTEGARTEFMNQKRFEARKFIEENPHRSFYGILPENLPEDFMPCDDPAVRDGMAPFVKEGGRLEVAAIQIRLSEKPFRVVKISREDGYGLGSQWAETVEKAYGMLPEMEEEQAPRPSI